MKTLREKAGFSQEQLSELVQVARRNVYAWEAGDAIPRLDRANVLARTLGVSMKELCEALGLSTDGIPGDSHDSKLTQVFNLVQSFRESLNDLLGGSTEAKDADIIGDINDEADGGENLN